MILTCPECATRYQTDAAQFPSGGRDVRCAKCSHVWHQDAPVTEPEPRLDAAEAERTMQPSIPAAAEPTAHHTAYAPQLDAVKAAESQPDLRRRGERVAIAAGWIGLAVIVMAVGWSAIRFREVIASVWPQSAPFYSMIGMTVNTRGIDLINVVSRRSHEDGQTVLAIRGRLVNVTSHPVPVPELSVKLTDDDQHELDHWTFTPRAASLKPGEKLDFATRRTNPPEDARHVEVSLAGAGG